MISRQPLYNKLNWMNMRVRKAIFAKNCRNWTGSAVVGSFTIVLASIIVAQSDAFCYKAACMPGPGCFCRVAFT